MRPLRMERIRVRLSRSNPNLCHGKQGEGNKQNVAWGTILRDRRVFPEKKIGKKIGTRKKKKTVFRKKEKEQAVRGETREKQNNGD